MNARALALVSLLVACTPTGTIGYVTDAGRAGSTVGHDAALAPDGALDDTSAPDGGLLFDECVPGVSTLSADTIAALRKPASATATWLYPYDQTAQPRGVGAPTLMWSGADADAVLLSVRGASFTYVTCGVPDSAHAYTPTNLDWARIETGSAGKADPLTLSVVLSGASGTASLPPRTLTIASEALKGSLYYMAYGSKLGPISPMGAIFRMPLGGTAAIVAEPFSCAGCHSLAANGGTMLAYADGLDHIYAWSAQGFNQLLTGAPNAEAAAVTPDGRYYVAGSRSTGIGPRYYGPATVQNAALVEVASGNTQDNSGLPTGALMPAFSPDGSALVFTDAALGAGNGIATMQFDVGALRLSNYRTVYQDPSRFPGWPTFLPTLSGVVFALGTRNDYSGNGALLNATVTMGPASDLYVTALETQTTSMLDRAMGFLSAADAAAERTYLPFGSDDLHQNYNPQVAPVSAGGFHWIFFDTVRHYGGVGIQRKIWCAAVDDSDPTVSYPPFYVRGQDADVSTFRPIFASDAQ